MKEGQLVSAPSSSHESPSAFVTLNMDCSEELFDWLSVADLLSLRRTCKRLKQTVDYYIQTNYPSLLSNRLIYGTFKIFQSIDANFPSIVKVISLSNITTYGLQYKKINESLLKVPNISINGRRGEFNVRPLFDSSNNAPQIDWCNQKYPELECVKLEENPIHSLTQLVTLFQLNQNIQTFEANDKFIKTFGRHLFDADIKFNRLVLHLTNREERICVKLFRNLKELHDRGFYRQLHLFCNTLEHVDANTLTTLGITKLSLKLLNTNLPPLPHLEEFFSYCYGENYLESIKDVVKRIHFSSNFPSNFFTNFEQILMNIPPNTMYKSEYFVRNFPKLKHLKIPNGFKCIDLPALNRERATLRGACKITIYVHEETFLSTKWTFGNTNYKWIELKRYQASDWHNIFFIDF
ncbi:uncharacterized protein LOC116349702 [Contarinia nasturtii]|uniref:uncharacterized protein LOC116349702 n=1 Tax=Contarinia nasturtii TaxID=265458 RepID=UPI0012D3E718|nr:uncharacterized protein LOC116349702 [Contarinia nasturtii]